ncbi:hypothetical protein WDU94_006577 [Cyamophila willieti]
MLVNKVGQHISLMGRSGNFHLILPTATVCSMVVGEHGPGHGSGRGTRSYLLRYKKSCRYFINVKLLFLIKSHILQQAGLEPLTTRLPILV